MKKTKNLEDFMTSEDFEILNNDQAAKITGGMKWYGAGSKNVEADQWTLIKLGIPWGELNGIKLAQ